MKVIMFNPGEKPYVTEIGNELKDLQQAVNGYIQIVYPYDDPVALVLDEDGKLNGAPRNRPFYNDKGKLTDFLYGPFFLCGVGEEDLTDIPDELIAKYMSMFPLK